MEKCYWTGLGMKKSRKPHINSFPYYSAVEVDKRIAEYEALIDRAVAHFDAWQSRRDETELIDDLIADMRKAREVS